MKKRTVGLLALVLCAVLAAPVGAVNTAGADDMSVELRTPGGKEIDYAAAGWDVREGYYAEHGGQWENWSLELRTGTFLRYHPDGVVHIENASSSGDCEVIFAVAPVEPVTPRKLKGEMEERSGDTLARIGRADPADLSPEDEATLLAYETAGTLPEDAAVYLLPGYQAALATHLHSVRLAPGTGVDMTLGQIMADIDADQGGTLGGAEEGRLLRLYVYVARYDSLQLYGQYFDFRVDSAAPLVPAGSAPLPVFADVSPSDWFYAPVNWAVRRGITSGTGPDTFSPGRTCTVKEILTFLYAASGRPPVEGTSPFSDVAPGDWYYPAALWAASAGLVQGDTLRPHEDCTRAGAVTYLWKLAGSPRPADRTGTFSDVPADAPYAQAVAWALEQGITGGTGPDTFSPSAICTRAQIMTFLFKALGQ